MKANPRHHGTRSLGLIGRRRHRRQGSPGRLCVFGLVGFMLPDMVLTFKARSRREQIQAELPDALDLLAVSVEAGLGFDGAIRS